MLIAIIKSIAFRDVNLLTEKASSMTFINENKSTVSVSKITYFRKRSDSTVHTEDTISNYHLYTCIRLRQLFLQICGGK